MREASHQYLKVDTMQRPKGVLSTLYANGAIACRLQHFEDRFACERVFLNNENGNCHDLFCSGFVPLSLIQ